ncbi:cryptic family protein 1B-like [Trichechus inunguis]
MSGYQSEKHKGGKEGINNTTTQKRQQKTLNWTLNNFSKVNGSAEGWRQQRDTLPHSWGFRESASTRSSCCQNGGTCVLGSFCVCPAHFTGRHCEHDPKRSECGAHAHGAWTVHGCRLCRCVYGALRCLARQTQGSCVDDVVVAGNSETMNPVELKETWTVKQKLAERAPVFWTYAFAFHVPSTPTGEQ